MKASQNKLILLHLLKGESITPLEALEKFKCWALSSRIPEIKKMLNPGEEIITTTVKENGKSFASYKLIKHEQI